jgi:hypothetical protein
MKTGDLIAETKLEKQVVIDLILRLHNVNKYD